MANSPNRAACPLLAAHLTTAAAFSILEAEQLSLDWSLGVESSCQVELTVIPVTVLLHPSVNISLTQVSLAMDHTTGRQPPPLYSVLYGIISKRR